MTENLRIQGFSKLSRVEKIRIASEFAANPVEFASEMISNLHQGNERRYEFSENALSEFRLPFSVAPNFLINGKVFMVPMVTEESSVVAAASSAAKFWYDHGGFITSVSSILKPGHIHFLWYDETGSLQGFFDEILDGLTNSVNDISSSMKLRGGGVKSIRLIDRTKSLENYYQVEVLFDTVDAMGANFINSCLETMAEYMKSQAEILGVTDKLEIVMAILSNYTPDCLVECQLSCKIDELNSHSPALQGRDFARKFAIAVEIAKQDVSRAVTHNKGIFNGIDAVVVATGNDFRAIEAAGHAWASRKGRYSGLSDVEISDGVFLFKLEIPLAIGVTGGITNLHSMTKASLQLLGNPDSPTLMSVTSSAGMANHFSAIKALVTEGIQKGHMKLHIANILDQMKANEAEKESAIKHFSDKKVTYHGVRDFILNLRSRLK